MMNNQQFEKYLSEFENIEGWFDKRAVKVLQYFNQLQLENSIEGDIFEIGAYKGKLTILLAIFLRNNEKLIVNDIFDLQNLNISRSGSKANYVDFMNNLSDYFNDLSFLEIIIAGSSSLHNTQRNDKFRIFSIDGGHSAEETYEDMLYASKVIDEKGIIILDDYYNSNWPGVKEGADKYCSEYNDLVPLTAFFNKFIYVKDECKDFYLNCLNSDSFIKMLNDNSYEIKEESLLSHKFFKMNAVNKESITPKNLDYIDEYINQFSSKELLKENLREIINTYSVKTESDNPTISIVIPSYNQGRFLEKTILSILLQEYSNYEIIIIDGGSNDESVSIIKTYEEFINYWVSEKDDGQADAINKGLKLATGQVFNWINSDDYLEKNALKNIAQIYSNNNNSAGWVGVCRRFDENNNTLNIIYPNNLERENIGQNWNGRQFYQPACFLNTKYVKEINGLDKSLNAPFDLDLWIRILEKGTFEIGSGVWANALIHTEAKTQKARASMFEETIAVQKKYDFDEGAANRYDRVFANGKLEFIPSKSINANQLEINNVTSNTINNYRNKKLIIVSNFVPRFDKASSNKRIFELLKIFISLEFKIDYIYRNETPEDEKYISYFSNQVNFHLITKESFEIAAFITSLNPDYVWVTNLWTIKNIQRAVEITYELKQKTNTKVIADTMDFHFKKYQRKYELSNNQDDLDTALQFLNYEKVLYKNADLVVTVTEEDKNEIIAMTPVSNFVDVIPNIHGVFKSTFSFSERKNICFLGNYKVNHNYDAVKNFVQNILPLIHKYEPDIEFHLLGNDAEKYCEEFKSEKVKLIGFVDDLESTLSEYKVFVCPMNYGAGMKGKIGEAAVSGLPIVSTSIGIEGTNLQDGENCFVADSAEEFAGKCLHLLSDSICWNNFSQKAKIKTQTNFGTDATLKRITKLFNELENDNTVVEKSYKDSHVENRVVRAGAKNLFDNDLLKINWVVTRKCNYTCSYCTVYDNENGYFQPIEKLINAVDQIKLLNRKNIHITLTGGEPTIHPKYAEFIKYLSNELDGKVLISTITNLSRTQRFFDELCEKLKPYKNKINFRASYHFEFADTEAFIENARIISSNGILIYISLLAHPERIEEVKLLEKRLKEIQNEKLKYEVIVVRENYGSVPDKRYSEEDLQWLNNFYTTSVPQKELIIDTENSVTKEIKREFYSAPELSSKGINNFKGMICNAGKNMFSINEDGEIDKAVCFRKLKNDKKNIYTDNEIFNDLSQPVVCPFDKCGCIADLQLPKYLHGFDSLKIQSSDENNLFSEKLRSKLIGKGWSHKFELYNKDFVSFDELKKIENPSISIIVISWRLHPDTLKNFQLLEKQRDQNFELIFVDNGAKENEFDSLKPFINTYVSLSRNTGAYVARNIGSIFTSSDKLLFLEDDGLPFDDFIKEHLKIFENYNIIALRGKYIPKTDNALNNAQSHYDLGEIPIPYYLNLEGNLSIIAKNFFQVNGFSDEIIYGFGGGDLAYKLKASNPEIEPNWYFPGPKIYHDFTSDSNALSKKIDKQEKSYEILVKKYPGFEELINYYRINYRLLLAEKLENKSEHAKECLKLVDNYKKNKNILEEKLISFSWEKKFIKYNKVFDSVEYLNKIDSPKISIVVISWRLHKDTIKNFVELEKQRNANFELIFVNNGADENEFESLKPYIDTYIKLNENTGAYLARNIGSLFAKSKILFFLEDDGIPENNLVQAHIDAHSNYDIIAVRGVYKFKTDNPFNKIAAHYYLGDNIFPIYSDLEGNTSYNSEVFYKVGGWDDDIEFGGGGVELSIRLSQIVTDRRKQIYSPDPVIYHDFVKDQKHYDNKIAKQKISRERLKLKHPNWDEYITSWDKYRSKEYLLTNPKKEINKTNYNYAPLVSICIPTFNCANLLTDAIDSALNQSYKNFEIIIVDDGSIDNTKEVLEKIGSTKIRYIFKEHTNAADTRNRAVKEAKGDFILWLDSDDILNEEILDNYIFLLNKHDDIDLIYCSLQAMKLNGEVFYKYDYPDYYKKNDDMFKFLLKGQPIPNGGTLIKRKIYSELGNYNPDFIRAHDYEFYTRLVSTKKYNAKYADKVLYTYRVHDNNITLNTSGKINYEYERKIFKKIISDNDTKILYPEIDWNSNPKKAESVVNLKIGLRLYELEGYEESINYLVKFFEIDRDEKNFLDIINKFSDDGNFMVAQSLIKKLINISDSFPNFNQIRTIIDNAVKQAQSI